MNSEVWLGMINKQFDFSKNKNKLQNFEFVKYSKSRNKSFGMTGRFLK